MEELSYGAWVAWVAWVADAEATVAGSPDAPPERGSRAFCLLS